MAWTKAPVLVKNHWYPTRANGQWPLQPQFRPPHQPLSYNPPGRTSTTPLGEFYWEVNFKTTYPMTTPPKAPQGEGWAVTSLVHQGGNPLPQ